MSFSPPINCYRNMVLSGWLPYPYHYPYLATAPNISNQSTNPYLVALDNPYYGYEGCRMYDRENNLCHNPLHSTSNNISYNHDPYLDKYQYKLYSPIPVQDPSYALSFQIQFLVSNVLPISVPVEDVLMIPPQIHAKRIPAVTPLKIPTINPIQLPVELVPVAANYDINLSDPWGILIANDIIWVASAYSGFINRYDLLGRPVAPPINVFGPGGVITKPTSIVYNPNQYGYYIYRERLCVPSMMIVATRDGTIHGYNTQIDPLNSTMVVNNRKHNTVYTGLLLSDNKLYAVDFYNKKIDIFNENFVQITEISMVDRYVEDPLPDDYAPYNIVRIGDFIYVSYTKQNIQFPEYEVAGCGNGYINIYGLDGLFVRRFASKGVLNVPWGMILVPSTFGYPAGSIMVANFGDGLINIFLSNGEYFSTLADSCGNKIYLEGLHGLTVNPSYNKFIHWSAKSICDEPSYIGSISTRLF